MQSRISMPKLFWVLGFLCLACVVGLVCSGQLRRGRPGVSNSAEESKALGVIIATFVPEENPLHLFDGLSAEIEQAWLERAWGYGADPIFETAEYQSTNSCTFCFVMAKKDLATLERVLGKYLSAWAFRTKFKTGMAMSSLDSSRVLFWGYERDSTSTRGEFTIWIYDPKALPDSLLARVAKATLRFERSL
jgi:hypothetical protein